MNILLTGASGFLGSRICHELMQSHNVTTVGRTAVYDQHVTCDLAKQVPILPNTLFDIVVNSAGKAHSVPRTIAERVECEQVNVGGTRRLLTALEYLPTLPKVVVHISTVLVYGRSEGHLLNEATSLDAGDAYGLSKINAEAVVYEWCQRMGVRVAILRLPLVAAEQPTGNLAAMMQAIKRGYYVRIGEGLARRSMVRADDVANVIIRAAETEGTFNLTDGYHPSVREIEDAFSCKAGRGHLLTVAYPVANAFAKIGDGLNVVIGRKFPLDSIALQKLTGSLTFSDEAARQHLNWNPRPVLDLFR